MKVNREDHQTPSDTNTASSSGPTFVIRYYSLNIDKTLKAKLHACDAVNVSYEVKGGGVTGNLDTASFEILRAACSTFYKNMPASEGSCVINVSEDKNHKAVVQQTYKVTRQHNGLDVSYTLNLYPTRNSLLLNGKDTDTFIDSHLPTIHQLMSQTVQEWEVENLANLNHILSEQFSKILEQRQPAPDPVPVINVPSPTVDNVTPEIRTSFEGEREARRKRPPQKYGEYVEDERFTRIQEQGQAIPNPEPANTVTSPIRNNKVPPGIRASFDGERATRRKRPSQKYGEYVEDEQTSEKPGKCLRCNRNSVTRGTKCMAGGHWIHYFCDRLTKEDEKRVVTDKGFIYVCKACRANSENTDPKTVVTGDSQILQLPAMPHPEADVQSDQTTVEILLQEENHQICVVCHESMGGENRCHTCSGSCHERCMQVDSNGDVTDICQNCAASQEQLQILSNIDSIENQEDGNRETAQDNNHTVERPDHHTQKNSSSNPGQEEESNQREVIPDQNNSSTDSSKRNKSQDNDLNVASEPKQTSRQSKKTQNQADAAVKLRELRQMEARLGKWEEELKQREATLNSAGVDQKTARRLPAKDRGQKYGT